MKVLNLKWILIVCGFAWVSFSFFWFTSDFAKKNGEQIAKLSIERSESELLQISKDLKFKLGQWSYNYYLVKTRGLDFDQDAFLNSEFDEIYFFKLIKGEFRAQWVKSKDMAAAVIPETLSSKLGRWSKSQVLDQEFIYFSEKSSSNISKVFFGFPILDESLGEGLLLSALDLDYVQLINSSLNTYLVDAKGRYVFHPNKEYIGQNSLSLLNSQDEGSISKTVPIKSMDLELIYKKKMDAILAQILGPNLVMFMGLFLIFGVLVFEIYMKAPLNLKSSLDISQAIDADNELSSDFSKDEYGAVLKLNEVRDSLNKMSLLSSALTGRLDLATNENIDKKLFINIKDDFKNLDKIIDSAYKSSQTLESLVEIPDLEDVDADGPEALGFNAKEIESVSLQPNESDLADLSIAENKNSEDKIENFVTEDYSNLDVENEDGVVFQEYMGAETESNDWAKIIDELTEEINSAELKPTPANKDV